MGRRRRYKGHSLGTKEVRHIKLTPAAANYISHAISERRHVRPKESQKQSVAIAHSKARKAGYHIPRASK